MKENPTKKTQNNRATNNRHKDIHITTHYKAKTHKQLKIDNKKLRLLIEEIDNKNLKQLN